MKILTAIAFVPAIRMLSAPSSAAGHSEQDTLTMAARIATMPFQGLQMLHAEPGSAHGPRWLVWSVGRGEGQSARRALFAVDRRLAWSVVEPDACLPTLVHVPGWSSHDRTVFLLKLDYGAGAEEAEVIALDRRGLPNVLDRRLAFHTALLPGGVRLQLDQATGSIPARSCLAWNAVISRLEKARC